jgi:8-oxo-dGTP diphosphatase
VTKPAHLQFGTPEPGVKYRDRPTVFGIAERRGQIALICVSREGLPPIHDLPGGEVEPGESEARALAREFAEETGLNVHIGEEVARADQYMFKSDGEPVNNHCIVTTAIVDGDDPGQKIEEDRSLVWMDPLEALGVLRLDSQAWAVACWIRRQTRAARGETT